MSANIQLSVASFSCCIPFSRAYSCALYKIYPRVVVTQLFRSPRWISMKTHGANAGPTRRFKRRSRANRSSRPSACRLRPLLIRHSFLTTANKFGLSIFPPPLNRASQLGGGHTSPLTTEATVTIRLPLARIWILEDPTIRSSQLEGIHEGETSNSIERSSDGWTSMTLLFGMRYVNAAT